MPGHCLILLHFLAICQTLQDIMLLKHIAPEVIRGEKYKGHDSQKQRDRYTVYGFFFHNLTVTPRHPGAWQMMTGR